MSIKVLLKNHHRPKRRLLAWLALALLLWGTAARAAWAHGGGTVHIAGEVAGPYRVTVWVAPNEVEAGKKLHFTVAVVRPENNQPVLDAQVMVQVTAVGDDTAVLSGPATTQQAVNKLFYEADFKAPQNPGEYQVQTRVSGSEGEGEVLFVLPIKPASGSNFLVIGLIGLVVIGGLGLLLNQRRETARRAD
ncbi:MAG: hypothetical protein IPH82_03700 [Chloroflexi bacterium]|nr:hypothetical protein [Chloroflexota bacterium]MBK7915837.1 hypothetical protein [Chloroflexota bacterium]